MFPTQIKLRRGRGKGPERHGMRKTVEYQTWVNIRQRCYSKGDTKYEYYGGRGITVCDEWLKSFVLFFLDMGCRPSRRHSIDRIDNDKGYSVDNCRWVTRRTQTQNRRPRGKNILWGA